MVVQRRQRHPGRDGAHFPASPCPPYKEKRRLLERREAAILQSYAPRLLVLAILVWWAFMAFFALTPRLPDPPLLEAGEAHTLGHFGTCAVLSVLLFLLAMTHRPWSFRRLAVAAAVLGVVAFWGLAIEALQSFTATRQASLQDLVVDIAGAFSGLVFILLLGYAKIPQPYLATGAAMASLALVAQAFAASALWTPTIPWTADCPGDRPKVLKVRDLPPALQYHGQGAPPRSTQGLVALYRFQEGQGATVFDASGAGAPVDLTVQDPRKVEWLPGGGLRLLAPGTAVMSRGGERHLYDRLMETDQFTLEVWAAPSSVQQDGPARLITLSGGVEAFEVNTHVGQEFQRATVRVRTTCDFFQQTNVGRVFAGEGSPRHLVVTYDGAATRLYVDGVFRVSITSGGGSLDNWDIGYPLMLGNEQSLDRPFLGDLYLAAVYDRALSEADVQANYFAGRQPLDPQA